MCEPNAKPEIETISDTDKTRLDLAWKWFAYHAEQRMKAFNFMILSFGVLSTAIVTCIDKHLILVGSAISVASLVITGLFYLLDLRNQHLVELGRDSLRALESRLKFASVAGTDILTKAYAESPTYFSALRQGRHSKVLPLFMMVFGILFLVSFVWTLQLHIMGSSVPNFDGQLWFCSGRAC